MVEPGSVDFGLFETLLVRNGSIHLFVEHIARMRSSARTLGIPVPEVAGITRAVDSCIRADEHAIRMEWRQSGGEWRLTIQAFAIPPLTLERRSGCRLQSLSTECRPEHPGWKTTRREAYARGLAHAADRGANEGLFLDAKGRVLEGTATNVFLIAGDDLVRTPPVDGSILPGVTRDRVIALLRDRGVQVREERFPASDLRALPSFVTSSLTLIAPVTHFDGAHVPQSSLPGSLRGELELEMKS